MVVRRGGLRLWHTLRSIGRTYAAQARFLLPAALVVFVPLGLLDAAVDLHVGSDDVDPLKAVTIGAVALAAGGVSAFGDQFYAGVTAAAVSESRTGRRRHSFAEVARTVPYLKLIAADIAVTLGTLLGLLLLIVPGIVFFTWFSLSAPVIKIERLGVVAALRRSRELVRGSFWQVLGLLGFLYLGENVLASAAGDGAFAFIGESFVADWVAVTVVNVLATPVLAVATVVLTYELIDLERAGAPTRR